MEYYRSYQIFLERFESLLNYSKTQIWIYPRSYNLQSIGILKLVKKAKFLPGFQSADLQNLMKFGPQEGHQFEFHCWVVGKSWKKSERGEGPLVSLSNRLNRTRSLASRAWDSCPATHRWPEQRRGRRPCVVSLILAPFSSLPWPKGEAILPSLSHIISLFLSLSLCAFAIAVPMSCQRCFLPSRWPPRHSCASFLPEWGHPQAAAPTITAAKATPEQADVACLLPPWEAHHRPHVFGHPWPRGYAVELHACAALLHVLSAGAFDHQLVPLLIVPHCRPMPPWVVSFGETPSSRCPKSEPTLPGLGPRPIPHRSSATGRPDFVGDHRRRGRGKIPYSWLPWAERPYGPDGSCRRSPMAQCDLFFSIRFSYFNIQIRI
jgi:hypothetical protein